MIYGHSRKALITEHVDWWKVCPLAAGPQTGLNRALSLTYIYTTRLCTRYNKQKKGASLIIDEFHGHKNHTFYNKDYLR